MALAGMGGGPLGEALLKRWRIHTRGVLGGIGVRISTACFNNEADVDVLLSALDELHRETAS